MNVLLMIFPQRFGLGFYRQTTSSFKNIWFFLKYILSVEQNILWKFEEMFFHFQKLFFYSAKKSLLTNEWSSDICLAYFTFILLIRIRKISTNIQVRPTLVGQLQILFGYRYKNTTNTKWKHSVRICLLYGIYNKGYCVFY